MGDIVAAPSELDSTYSRVMEWRPARLISDEKTGNDFALLVLNQPLNNIELLKTIWKKGVQTPCSRKVHPLTYSS